MRMTTRWAAGALCAAVCVHSAPAAHPVCVAVAPGAGVDGLALANLLANWTGGSAYAPCPPFRVHDFNEDCRVNGLDLASLLAAWGTDCGPLVTQLAGNPLALYPYFEYVRAFNQGAPLRVAIDPSRFPQFVGKSCNVYIVAHKTPAQWSADPALVDVTSGGFQSEAITAGTIQANTFTISGGSALNGTAGAQVGVGYDVVFDCNRNAMLDASDVIDGTISSGAGVVDEAGLYVVRDTTAPGPYAPVESPAYEVSDITSRGDTLEQAFYPASIASLGQLPLIVVSHGAGHNFLWYDHIGNHMASYGYIVMSHQNNIFAGVGNGAVTTIQHTNAFIGQQASILGGVLSGHIDGGNIAWIGHSRGGDGVAVAYDHLFDGTPLSGGPYVPVGWSVASIKVISSMAPINSFGPGGSNPHDATFHLWIAEGDSDVTGCAGFDLVESFQLHDRASGFRQSTSLFGAGHGDLHAGSGVPFFSGPCPIGKVATNTIQRGYFLPLFERYFHGDIPSSDFLWRQWERFRPIGAPAPGSCPPPSGTGEAVVVDLIYRDDPATAAFIIDDNLTNPSTGLSSSGGAVTFTVTNVFEGVVDDAVSSFAWTPSDPMNGMTHASATDTSSGVVFDWSGPAFYELAIPSAHQDWTGDAYLSFRACQGTHHPNTIALLGDLTFEVVLRDAASGSSRINIGAYGGGIEEPYQRNGCGAGTGWNNEFETIRIRLTDFLHNGSALDLGAIVALRFEFAAPGSGSSVVGRLGLGEIYLTRD